MTPQFHLSSDSKTLRINKLRECIAGVARIVRRDQLDYEQDCFPLIPYLEKYHCGKGDGLDEQVRFFCEALRRFENDAAVVVANSEELAPDYMVRFEDAMTRVLYTALDDMKKYDLYDHLERVIAGQDLRGPRELRPRLWPGTSCFGQG